MEWYGLTLTKLRPQKIQRKIEQKIFSIKSIFVRAKLSIFSRFTGEKFSVSGYFLIQSSEQMLD